MSANKTRVQVRGTVGKSVRFPTDTGGSGATIGLDFKLPDGSVPTLQQLAAALVTGAALQDQPGNIIPPGGGPTVIWQNIQYVPANIIYPARPVIHEDDAGEEYNRMAVPGPVGPRGLQGFSGVWAEDAEDPAPGPPGAAGAKGSAGAQGPLSTMNLWPEDPEDPVSIPGAAGPPGANGAQGAPGLISAVHLWPDDAEDPGLIPGAPGQAGVAGAQGAPGLISAVHLWPDDAEDPGLIPGAAGPAGQNGAQGAPGVISAVHLWPDEAEDVLHLPGPPGNIGATGAPGIMSTVHLWPDDAEDPIFIQGPQGNVGATGAAGSSSSAAGVGWAAYLDYDAPEEQLYRGPHRVVGGGFEIQGGLVLRAPGSNISALTVNQTALGQYAVKVQGNGVSTLSDGVLIAAGTTSADTAIAVTNDAATAAFFSILGDGSGHLGPAVTTGLSWTATGIMTVLAPSGAGTHTINSNTGASDTLALNAPSGTFTSLLFQNAGTLKAQIYWNNSTSRFRFLTATNGLEIDTTGNIFVAGRIGRSGVTAAAQVTGFGTPTGAAVVANFPGAGPATLAQCSSTIAQILTILKGDGTIGA